MLDKLTGGAGFNTSQNMALDSRGLEGLKQAARSGPGSEGFDKAIDETAKQFESVFLSWALKSMREASIEGGLFSDSASKSFEAMYDKELVQSLSGRGIGLAGEIAKQLKSLSGTSPNQVVGSEGAEGIKNHSKEVGQSQVVSASEPLPSTLPNSGR